MGKTAVFGGTFNPFHNGHLEIVNALLKLQGVDGVVVIPTAKPPHKTATDIVSGEHRLNMCLLATKGLNKVSVSDIELSRGGRSYTYDTIIQLKELLKTDIAITCGADMITSLNTWYRYEDLLKNAEIIAFRRVGIDGELFEKAVVNIKNDGGTVTVVDCSVTEVSSTQVRGGDFSLVPAAVVEYIKQNKLYGV